MGERMELLVDVGTQRGVEAMQQLTRALEENVREVQQASSKIEKLEQDLRQVADSAAKAAKEKAELTKATKTAADEAEREAVARAKAVERVVQEVREEKRAREELAEQRKAETARQVERVAQEVREERRLHDEMREKKRQMEEMRTEKGLLSVATRNLQGQVVGWLSAYAGIGGVIQLVDTLNRKMREAREARDELVGQKWSRDQALLTVMDNFGLTGRGGEDTARQLVSGLAGQIASTFETAGAVAASGKATGFDLREAGGAGVVTSVGRFASRMRLGPRETELVFKLLSNRGVSTPDQANLILSKLEATAQSTGITNNAELMGSLLQAVDAAVLRGGDLDRALAHYSTAATGSASAERGAEQVKMFYQIADPGEPEARAAVAAEAARRGFISARPPTAAEIQRELRAGRRKSALAVADLDDRIANAAAGDQLDDRGFESNERDAQQRIADLEAQARKARHGDDRQRALREAADARADLEAMRERRAADLERRARERQQMQRDRDIGVRRLSDEILGERALQGFNQLGFDQKTIFAMQLFGEAQGDTPQARAMQAKLQEMFPGRSELQRAAMIQSSPSYVARALEALPSIRGADPAAQARRFGEFLTTSTAQNNRAQAEEEAKNDAAVGDPAMEAAVRLSKRGAERARRDVSNGRQQFSWKLLTDGGFIDWLLSDQKSYEADASRQLLMEEMNSLWSSLSPEQQEANPELGALIQNFTRGGDSISSEQVQANTRDAAVQFYRMRSQLRPAADGAARPTTQPTGEPMSSSQTIYNVSVGNLFTQGGGALDLPGRLEDFG